MTETIFTYDGLIEQIKQEEEGILGINIPLLSMHFIHFADKAQLDSETFYNLQSYIKKESYDNKRQVFEKLGFSVLFMTLSAVKLIHLVEGSNPKLSSSVKSINQSFLDKERNVFIFDVSSGTNSLYFLLEYKSDEPLSDHTVDWEEIDRKKARKERARSIFSKNRTKKQ